jgi:hypothetical protein
VLTPASKLRVPPTTISAVAILPENLVAAWKDGKANVPITFHLRLGVGDGKTRPSDATVQDINKALKDLDEGFMLH